jgi:alanine racemase
MILLFFMGRSAIATLSTENLLHNVSVMRHRAPNALLMAMIKANAYGHGIRSVAIRLANVVNSFGVASLDEAMAIRQVGIKTPITLMEGVFEPNELLIASTQRFQVVFHDPIQLEWLKNIKLPLPIQAWLKVDSGMGRLGFDMQNADRAYQLLQDNSGIQKPIGIMSHLACADTQNHPLNLVQIKSFKEFSSNKIGQKSLLNSAGLIHFPEESCDLIRVGLSLYGISPIKKKSAKDLNLKPVMSLQTRLIAVREHVLGSHIGYGGEYVCSRNMLIGVIAMGYGDGYPRSTASETFVLVNDILCPIVGRISMDMITIDITLCPDAKVGDPVILWGEQLPIENVAAQAGRSVYELVTNVAQRVKFHWTVQM